MQIECYEGIHFAILPMRLHDPSKVQDVLSLAPKEGFGLQIMDAEVVAGYEHLSTAIKMAIKAFKENRKIAKTIAMEALLYASAKRQIKEAIESVSSSESGRCVIIVISPSKEELESTLEKLKNYGLEDESLVQLTDGKLPKILRLFEIRESEISLSKMLHSSDTSAVQSLVLERVSLSDLNR